MKKYLIPLALGLLVAGQSKPMIDEHEKMIKQYKDELASTTSMDRKQELKEYIGMRKQSLITLYVQKVQALFNEFKLQRLELKRTEGRDREITKKKLEVIKNEISHYLDKLKNIGMTVQIDLSY